MIRFRRPYRCSPRAWARCVQVIGALDAAVEFSVAHTREREQFGRPLSAFQVVQHSLAAILTSYKQLPSAKSSIKGVPMAPCDSTNPLTGLSAADHDG